MAPPNNSLSRKKHQINTTYLQHGTHHTTPHHNRATPDFPGPGQEPKVRDDRLQGGREGEEAAFPKHKSGKSRVRQNKVLLFSSVQFVRVFVRSFVRSGVRGQAEEKKNVHDLVKTSVGGKTAETKKLHYAEYQKAKMSTYHTLVFFVAQRRDSEKDGTALRWYDPGPDDRKRYCCVVI